MTATLLGFNALAVAMTFLGGMLPWAKMAMSRPSLWRMFSLRSGILLAITFMEILPEALNRQPLVAGWGALFAFLFLYSMGSLSMLDSCPEYLEECPVHFLGWVAMLALSAHSFLDGLNLSVSFSAGAFAGTAIGTTLALHKLADGFTLTSLFRQEGFSRRKSLAALGTVAVATPLGSLLTYKGIHHLSPEVSALALGFAAGCFLYIGAMDILPRIHKDTDKIHLLYFGAGMLMIVALRSLGFHGL